jgi:hypothetical protein
MGLPAGVARYVLVGHLPNGEIFNTGFWARYGDAVASQAGWQTSNDTRYTSFISTWVTVMKNYLDTTCGYDELRAYYYRDAGAGATYLSVTPINVAGTNASNPLPMDTAAVQSLRTATPGRSYRGRMYVPVTNSLVTNHQFVTTLCSTQANATAAMFSSYNADSAGNYVAVVSRTLASYTKITRVIVDSIPDVQRRREQSLTPAFAPGATVT